MLKFSPNMHAYVLSIAKNSCLWVRTLTRSYLFQVYMPISVLFLMNIYRLLYYRLGCIIMFHNVTVLLEYILSFIHYVVQIQLKILSQAAIGQWYSCYA